MKAAIFCVAALAGSASLLCAQSSVSRGTTTVSGHVFFADTNGPARMASVTLQPAAAIEALRSDKKPEKAISSQSVQTLLDGSFTMTNVEPGTYYVIASAPGYMSPVNALLAAGSGPPQDDATRKKLAMLAPTVTAQANLPASVNVSLERGGAVSGTVLYDDGSPASGIRIELLVRRNDKWTRSPHSMFNEVIPSASTDDRGNFRIAGLPAQQYAVEAQLGLQKWIYRTDPQGGTSASSTQVYSLSVYSGNHFRMKDAEGFSISLGEERGGEDMEIPVSRLHALRGNITAAHDGHIINGGRVTLLYPDDKSEVDSTEVTRDGEFNFMFVPEGDYILRVTGAADTEYREVPNAHFTMPPTHTETTVLRRYGDGEMPIHIAGDMTGVVLSAPELKAQSAASN